MSLLIKNGIIVTIRGNERANLLLINGKIEAVTTLEPQADKTLNADGLFILPGIVDPHVHFRQPGMESEDWVNGSRAALAGGVTTVLDMPNTRPPTITLKLLKEKAMLVESTTSGFPCINYGFHFGATSSNLVDISEVGLSIRKPPDCPAVPLVASVKIFMGSSTGDLLITEMECLRAIVRASKLVTVHAEDEPLIKAYAGEKDHASQRPKKAALSAIRKLRVVGSADRVYVCHLTSYEEAELADGFYREATPHHLFLTLDTMSRIGNYAKVNPPLRDEGDRASLWRALGEGKIHTIGSDHAPHTRQAKESSDPPSGMPGVETSLPLMLDAASKGIIKLERVAALMSHNPSRIFKIKGKGEIRAGLDADLAIVDIKKEKRITADDLHYKCGWTPYEGMTIKGWPIITVLGGEIAYMDDQFYPVRGKGVIYEL